MSATNFHRNHKQHIGISEKLTVDLQQTGQDLQNQISKLNEKSSDQIIIIKVVNGLVGGVYGVIPNLQEVVIKSNTENDNNADLKDIIQKLSQSCNEMVKGYNSDFNTLKTKFQTFVQNVLSRAEDLLNIIKRDSLHDFKHELVETLKEMLYMLHRSQTRIQVESYSPNDLKNLVERIQKGYFDDVSKIESCTPDVLKTTVINMKYNVRHILQVAYYLNKVASNYDDIEIQKKILDAANLINVATTSVMLISEKLTDTKQTVTVLTEYSLHCWDAVRRIFDFIDIRLENAKKSANLSDVIKEVASYGIAINTNFGRSVKNDSLFAK